MREIESACLTGAKASLDYAGFVPAPQLHMLIDAWDQPYVGYVETREYYEGADAVSAIGALALLPAAVCATRVMLVWEEADVRASLWGPGDHPNGLVAVAATLTSHTVCWNPFVLHLDRTTRNGLPAVRAEWGRRAVLPGAPLPPVMQHVLSSWRDLTTDLEQEVDFETVLRALMNDGYRVHLVDPTRPRQ